MIEALVEKDDLLMDTPFLQRIREQGKEELTQGLTEGLSKDQLIVLREKIVYLIWLSRQKFLKISKKVFWSNVARCVPDTDGVAGTTKVMRSKGPIATAKGTTISNPLPCHLVILLKFV